ncbi:hypothetical protein F7725_010323 [Dissostichus mawsoni]|uniref:Fork-head domain-containing protein n=1 Tax=Dissostichus mawsoni TaxID=36200 RepID=A0A7J5XN56_DISMA|nr:hypothetical protein F7725_010323 [Dissostichus mawsoni]
MFDSVSQKPPVRRRRTLRLTVVNRRQKGVFASMRRVGADTPPRTHNFTQHPGIRFLVCSPGLGGGSTELRASLRGFYSRFFEHRVRRRQQKHGRWGTKTSVEPDVLVLTATFVFISFKQRDSHPGPPSFYINRKIIPSPLQAPQSLEHIVFVSRTTMEDSSVPPIDPDFEPQSRPRSCTWPLPRPDISAVKPEGADGSESSAGTPPGDEDKPEPQQITSEPEKALEAAGAEGGAAAGGGGATPRKGSSRRNAWGNQSYADLISQAIENSPEKRLTLAQVYEWMVKTVPYFRDKGDSNSSAGWKNSIRHNLSLHNKFLRFPKWGNSGSPSSRGSLDDSDMWTTFRPRTSSNASTLSGRLGTQASQCGSKEPSSFSNSLFNPMRCSPPTPPPSDVMMTQVDPLMQSPGGMMGLGSSVVGVRSKPNQLLLGKGLEPNTNLDCDVDYIINSDLMDGDVLDFNFDPILPGGQGYAGPASTQGSAHSWVPS